MMKILLINPPRFRGMSVIREERCERVEGFSIIEPYSLLQIAAILREKGHTPRIIDANAENLPYAKVENMLKNSDYDMLIFRFTPTTFDHDMKLAEISKSINSKAKTVGICFTLRNLSKEVMEEAKNLDIYIRHEYEQVTPPLIENIDALEKVDGITYRENGNVLMNKDSQCVFNYDDLPTIPAYDLLPSFELYYISTPHGKPFTIMYSSKGCPFQCTYCTVSNTKLKLRPSRSILKEIEYLKENYNIKTISFFDETFTFDRTRVLEICEGIKEFNINWYCNTRTNLVDFELLKTMRDAGCKGIAFGIESGSQKILDGVSKGITVKEQKSAIKMAKNSGMKVHCSFIFGLPGETKGTIRKTLNFVNETLPNGAEFNIATPYPGTKLFNSLVKKGLLQKNINFRELYQDKAQFKLCDLSIDELEKARIEGYKSLYTNPRWLFQNIMHVIKNPEDLHLAINYFFRYILDASRYKWSTYLKAKKFLDTEE
jgi:radical SAM superfamily enzyme YgiQ (UPF0313 family)